MERMEVDQCACAAPGGGGGGGALLRRSNSAPMITHLSDSSLLFQSCGNRCRRSSVSVNLSCPGLSFPLSPVQMSAIHMESPVIFQGDGSDTFPRGRLYSREAPAALESIGAWPESCDMPLSDSKIGIMPSYSPHSLQRLPRSHVTLGVSTPALGSLKRNAALGLAVWEEFLMEILQCLSKHHASSLHPFSPLKLRMTHVTATFSAFETLVTHGRIIQKI